MHEQHESSVELGDLVETVCFSILSTEILASISRVIAPQTLNGTAVPGICTDLFSIPKVVRQLRPRNRRINPLLLFISTLGLQHVSKQTAALSAVPLAFICFYNLSTCMQTDRGRETDRQADRCMYMSLCRQYISVHIPIGYNATMYLATRPLVKPAGRCSLANSARQPFALHPLACCEPDSLRGFSCRSDAIRLETS